MPRSPPSFSFPHPAPTDIYTLSLHDALPISPVTLNSTADNDFLITPTQLEASINEHTRLLILNSPSNPSGQAYSRDRKSTRLNSSHVAISYAVFCLKKKK